MSIHMHVCNNSFIPHATDRANLLLGEMYIWFSIYDYVNMKVYVYIGIRLSSIAYIYRSTSIGLHLQL